jgi:hypothetical protein
MDLVVKCIIKMEIVMKVNGKTINELEEENYILKMEHTLRVHFKMIRCILASLEINIEIYLKMIYTKEVIS